MPGRTGGGHTNLPTVPRSAHLLTRRALLRGAGAAFTASLVGCGTPLPRPLANPPRLRLLGEAVLPHRMPFKGTTVGGLSGLDFDPGSGTWVAISDDRSQLQPARFYILDIDVRASGLAVEPR